MSDHMKSFQSSPFQITSLERISANQVQSFGGKAVNLARLHKIGIPIPKGFAISTQGFIQFQACYQHLESFKALQTEQEDIETLLLSTKEFQSAVRDYEMPKEVTTKITSHFHQFMESQQESNTSYAVRSSATSEDTEQFSFAGQANTFPCVKDLPSVLTAIKQTWLSLYSARALLYMQSKGITPSQVQMGIIIQEMVLGEVSGVMFTANVISNNRDQLIIDSTWGLGEGIVSGKVTPDSFLLQKAPLTILQRNLGNKTLMCTPHPVDQPESTMLVETPDEKARIFSLADNHLIELTQLGLKIEQEMGSPQDIEWTFKDGKFVILQTRPITTL